ncbi:MAG: response regulator [Akkermansiaceae bacterium]|nr:response regulator [Verrucomicrobiales bacterium]
MKKPIHILMLEDSPVDAELAKHTLRQGGLMFDATRVEDEKEFTQEIRGNPPDVILSDYALPGFDGYRALEIANRLCPETPFIFLTGTMGEEVAIETLKNGATDYVLKHRMVRLVPSVHRALREAQERRERRRAEKQLRESHEQLRALSVYLQRVREEERTRIAREVHDELGQALTSCKLDLSIIASRMPRNLKPLIEKARELSAHMDSTIQTVRRISTELRPGILDHLGLVAALEWQANEFQNRTGIKCDIHTTLHEATLDANLATTFFRIFQETLTNIIRHAGATQVSVHLKEEGRGIVMDVRDNGRGIVPEEISNTSSLGLLGMKERAALLGGEFKIAPVRSGQGTRVTVSIPMRGIVSEPHEDSPNRRSRSRSPRLEANSRR